MAQRLADPERELALTYARAKDREALRALWALDERFGAIVAETTDATIGEMRLLWWREALAREERAPAEPLLRAIEQLVVPHGVIGGELGAMAEGWHALLQHPLGEEEMRRFASERGGRLFGFSARLLGGWDEAWIAQAGEVWALTDLARRVSDVATARRVLALAKTLPASLARARWPRALRPLGALAALARQDAHQADGLRPRGSPRRIARMIWVRIAGN